MTYLITYFVTIARDIGKNVNIKGMTVEEITVLYDDHLTGK